MSRIIIGNSGRFIIENGGRVDLTNPIIPNVCPTPTDDFSSYSLGAFPQGSWVQRENSGSGTSAIVGTSGAFPSSQQLQLGASTGATTQLSHTYSPVSWEDGQVQCKIASDNTGTANVQGCLIAQFIDTSNFLELRLRLDTGSQNQVLLFEYIGGTPNNRGSFTPPSGYTADTVYTLDLIINGTDARCRLLDENCQLIGTAGVTNDFTFTITGGNNGESGVKRLSQGTPNIFFDDFYTAAA